MIPMTAPYAGSTCAGCGAQWPDPAPADGAPAFCDGLCQIRSRTAVPQPPLLTDDPGNRYAEYLAAVAHLRDDADRIAATRYLLDTCPVIDLSAFDLPRGES
jgi:hypothetical protein